MTSGTLAVSPAVAQTAAKKPNILVIWGDDIGVYNISAYNRGGMGFAGRQHQLEMMAAPQS